MREKGWTIGTGYGKLKSETIRIGHMGDHSVARLGELLQTLERVTA
jgi:aspartate aminotransferase-like enzyme